MTLTCPSCMSTIAVPTIPAAFDCPYCPGVMTPVADIVPAAATEAAFTGHP